MPATRKSLILEWSSDKKNPLRACARCLRETNGRVGERPLCILCAIKESSK